jgi:alpha-tubulin suppressor-like RCC1 family protein
MKMQNLWNNIQDNPGQKRNERQAGGIVFTLFASIALIGILGAGAMTVLKGPAATMSKVSKIALSENNTMVAAKIAIATTMTQASGGDCDGDGVMEPLEGTTTGKGVAPTGGRFIPASLNITREDSWGTTLGYCVWDHGSVRTTGCPTNNRLAGQANAEGPLIAVISAGPDRVFQTTCGAAPAYVTDPAGSDDIIMTNSFSETQSQLGGVWNLKSGDATTAEVSKTIEVKNSSGIVNFALDGATGIGEFIGLVVGKIRAKLTADPVTLTSGVKIDNSTNVTACSAGQEGTLRRHNTNGLEVCDGTSFVAAGTGGGGSGGSGSGEGGGAGGGSTKTFYGKVSVGRNHSCAVRLDGYVFCWGRNNVGQLGDQTTTNSSTPKLVLGGHKFSQIAVGELHTCGLRTDGIAMCWGFGANGQLGHGSTANSSIPVAAGTNKYTSLTAGLLHTCGLRTDGGIYCWGLNEKGQIGNNTLVNATTPTLVLGGHKFITVSAGYQHTCGLRADGAAMCWGDNEDGQIGDNTLTLRRTPVLVSGDHKFLEVRAGTYFSCGLLTDGSAMCWGVNDFGQLGDGTLTNRSQPVAVLGGHKYSLIQTGIEHTCGIRTDSSVLCWGRNELGQVGDNATARRPSPTVTFGGSGWSYIASKESHHSCGIKSTGAILCWGYNQYGQIGDGTTVNKLIPTHINLSMMDFDKVSYHFADDGVACTAGNAGTVRYHATNGIQICNGATYGPLLATGSFTGQHNYYGNLEGKLAAGYFFNCALRVDGTAYCWGENEKGQLGNGGTADSLIPVRVRTEQKFVEITAGETHACGLRKDGAAYCWGENTYGQFGNGGTTDSSIPVAAAGVRRFSTIKAGEYHTCGISTNGVIYCWGRNISGEVGDNSFVQRLSPVTINSTLRFTQLTAGNTYTCAIATTGDSYCWGYGNNGQLGNNGNTDTSSPVLVLGGLKFTRIHAAMDHTCGITSEGKGYCWGANDAGKLGDGTTTRRMAPTEISGGHKFSQIIANIWHTCGIKLDGSAMCWGENENGQLGDGTTTDKLVPTPVVGGGLFAKLGLSGYTTCGIRTNGVVQCWGANWFGNVGDGTSTARNTPTYASGLSVYDLQNSSFKFSNSTATCNSTTAGTLRYVGGANQWEYCNGATWGKLW